MVGTLTAVLLKPKRTVRLEETVTSPYSEDMLLGHALKNILFGAVDGEDRDVRYVVTMVLIGFVAQFIDGSLGMAYGVTTSTLLLGVGIAPAIASASIHIAELGTTAASAFAHYKFGNIDKQKVLWIGLPGGIAAFLGAISLAAISGETARPWVSVILAGLGVYILLRFSFRKSRRPVNRRPIAWQFLLPLGCVAGFMDAVGGGGWGPIATPTLLASGRMEPSKVVGTVDASEFLVALGASAGFLLVLDFARLPWLIVASLLIGGIIAAPLAAYLVRMLPVRVMGAAVGGIILLTNVRTLLLSLELSLNYVYPLIIVFWLLAVLHAFSLVKKEANRAQ